MKKRMHLILFVCFFTVCSSGVATAQSSEYAGVKKALVDYIDGTATGNIEQIRGAFHPNAALYTLNEDLSLKEIPLETYLGFFTPGKVNNRKGHIVSIDLVKDAAMAKVEIDMGKRRYTDYMLLLKEKGVWQIIKKSYTFEPYERKGRILMVVSSADRYGETDIPTGAHYGEIVHPYHVFHEAGYAIDIVSPEGGMVPVAYVQLQDSVQKKYFYDVKLNEKLKKSLHPSEVKTERYDAIYFAGGAAAMFDLPDNAALMEITRKMYEDQQGVVGAVCHGPAGLVNVKLSNGNYLISGKKVNAFTNAEEAGNSKKQYLPFLLQSKLEERGGKFENAPEWEPHVAVDGRLITGQNPASCEQLAREMINKIEEAAQ